MKNPQRASRFLLLAIALALGAPASAQTWTGGAGNGLWTTGGNWSGGVPPANASTTVLAFPPVANQSSIVDTPYTLNRMDVSSSNYFFSGSALTFDGLSPTLTFSAGGIATTIATAVAFPQPTLVDTTGSGVHFSGSLSGAGGIVKTGVGSVTISNSIYSGPTVIQAGNVSFGNGLSGPGVVLDVVVNNPGSASFVVPGGVMLTGSLTGTGSILVSSQMAVAGPPLSHSGITSVFPSGTLDGSIDNAGQVFVSGTWNTSNSTVGALGNGGGNINVNGGTLRVGAGNLTNTFDGCLGGLGNLEKIGTGTLVLAATCMHSGLTTVTGGTLRIGNGVVGPGVVMDVVNNAALQFNVPGGIAINSTLSGTGTLTILGGNAAAMSGPLVHAGTTTINAGGTLDASITNNSRLTANGTFNTGGSTIGSLVGTGSVFINSGTLTVGTDNTNNLFSGTLGGAGDLTKVGTGLQVNGGNSVQSGLTTINAGAYRLGVGSSGPGLVFSVVNNAIFQAFSPALSLNGNFSGPGLLQVMGGNFVQGAGSFTHTGPTTIGITGTLAGSINNAAVLTIDAGGTMETGGSTVGQLTGAGQLNVNSGTFITGTDNADSTFSGGLAVFGAFVKSGTGRFTFSGTGTQAGPMTVNQGSMALTGTTTTPIVVNTGTTLLGTGTASGGVTVDAGATLAPGLSPGLLNTGNLVVAGVLLEEIEGPVLGTQYDSINATGTVDITGATLTIAGAYVPVPGDTFTIITNDGVDPVVGTFAGLPEGANIVFQGRPLTISYVGGTGNDVVLAFAAAAPGTTAIPTLSQWMLMLLASLLLAAGCWNFTRARAQ